MVDFDCKTTKMVKSTPNLSSNKSPPNKFSTKFNMSPAPGLAGELSPASESACSAYETYLRLPDLRRLWSSKDFPGWDNESIIKPALQALEITFRFISIVLFDARPYLNRREWNRRLEGLARDQVELISVLCEDDDEETRGAAPTIDLSPSSTVVHPPADVWKLTIGGESTVVSRTSQASLLPRLSGWQRSAELSSRIFYAIESAMSRCSYTLGLGEPNLAGKPNLDYDVVCQPSELHALNMSPYSGRINNPDNPTLFTIHQIFESWVFAAKQILNRIRSRIESKEISKAADDCWVLERIWKLIERIENLHLLLDPDDFLHLKAKLRIKSPTSFRSRALIEITNLSKNLRHEVPKVLEVEVDPMGGPIIQEAAMGLYREKRSFEKIHLLQAFQGVESAVKGFYYNYMQLVVILMGSLEAKANQTAVVGSDQSCDLLAQMFLEPTYYPSLDGAKTFLGDFWEHDDDRTVVGGGDLHRRNRNNRRWR